MKLALRKSEFDGVEMKEVVAQIAAAAKAKDKLPTWYETPGIYYPSKLSVEQTSSEITARYKASLIEGESLIDLTGGFGVDAYFFAKKAAHVIHCEIQPDLSAIALHNFRQLGVGNVECRVGDGTQILRDHFSRLDWIYVDPARRHDLKGKVFRLSDCQPDVTSILDEYFRKASHVLIKASPLIDLTSGIRDLRFVKEVHIVSVQNEVKELLWLLEDGFTGDVTIRTINFGKDIQEFSFNWGSGAQETHAAPGRYLYEPNAALMKSGGFGALSEAFQVSSLHKHAHLFTSDTLLDFPGRRFEIQEILPYGKEAVKIISKLPAANLSVRHFPESVADLRKRTRLKDGGDTYIFFTTSPDDRKIVLICTKN